MPETHALMTIMMLLHEQSQKFTENEKMKCVYIDSKELKGKLDYIGMLLFFVIVFLIFFIIKYFGFSGIIKWRLSEKPNFRIF